jgi:hypothetical protein
MEVVDEEVDVDVPSLSLPAGATEATARTAAAIPKAIQFLRIKQWLSGD